jgi:hypothetical protein
MDLPYLLWFRLKAAASLRLVSHFDAPDANVVKRHFCGTMAYALIPRLSSHGVRIFASYCSNGFLTGGLFNSRHAYTESAQAVNSGLPHKLKNVVPFQHKSAKILFSIRSITFYLG